MSFVTLWKATSTGLIADTEARYTLSPKQALIAAYMQLQGNYNTWEYPNDLPGMVKSHFIRERYYIEYDNGDILQADLA